MIEDVLSITAKLFDEFILNDKKLNSAKKVYDVYRNIEKVLDNLHTTANHYLALDFSEDFLQNSSFGEPIDKWRWGINKDLEQLNKSIKKYLLSLQYISFQNSNCFGSLLSKYFNIKYYYGYVRDEYNVGFIEPCGCDLIQHNIDVKSASNAIYLDNFNRIDLSTYEKRVYLQKVLQKELKILKNEFHRLKEYILENVGIEELL